MNCIRCDRPKEEHAPMGGDDHVVCPKYFTFDDGSSMSQVTYKPGVDISLSYTLIKAMSDKFEDTFETFPTFIGLGMAYYSSGKMIETARNIAAYAGEGRLNLPFVRDMSLPAFGIRMTDGGHSLLYEPPEDVR